MTSEQQQQQQQQQPQQQQQQQKQRPGLTGEQLENYCLQHGLCPLCAKTTTHQRKQIGPTRLKLSSSSHTQNQRDRQQNQQHHIWYPLTVTTLNDNTVDAIVVHNGNSGSGGGGGTTSSSNDDERGIIQNPSDVSEAVSKFNQFSEIRSSNYPQQQQLSSDLNQFNSNSPTNSAAATTTTKKKKKAGFFSSKRGKNITTRNETETNHDDIDVDTAAATVDDDGNDNGNGNGNGNDGLVADTSMNTSPSSTPGTTEQCFLRRSDSNQSLTNTNTQNTNTILVYKGFCIRPGCFTIDQAKRLCGEVGPFMTTIATSTPTGFLSNNNYEDKYYSFSANQSILNNEYDHDHDATNTSTPTTDHPNEDEEDEKEKNSTSKKKKGFASRLFGGGGGSGGSGRGGGGSTKKKSQSKLLKKKYNLADAAADGTLRQLMTETSGGETKPMPPPPLPATISTPISPTNSDDHSMTTTMSSTTSSTLTGKIRRPEGDEMEDDNMSIGSAMTSHSRVRTSLKELLLDQQALPPGVSPTLSSQRTLLLDLSHTRLHHVHVVELVQALSIATSLQTLILENCKLNDNECEVIGNGLVTASSPISPTSPTSSTKPQQPPQPRPLLSLVRLSLRSNKIGNRGVVGLCGYFQVTTTLKELDLSKNQIGSRGASSVLHAFRDNPYYQNDPATTDIAATDGDDKDGNDGDGDSDCGGGIEMINFAHNEIWDVDDGTFFAQNTTLKLLNLEGNFIHDEGFQSISHGLRVNSNSNTTKRGGTKLEEIYLGWNGIGDEGCLFLSRMIESNSTIKKIGLGENDITSIGARAILNALAYNDTLHEITGLYHNQIDRKFVIESISRILYSQLDILSPDLEQQRRQHYVRNKRSSMNAMDTLVEPLGSHLPSPDEVSEGSLDWADRLYNDDTEFVVNVAAVTNSIPLLGEVSVTVTEEEQQQADADTEADTDAGNGEATTKAVVDVSSMTSAAVATTMMMMNRYAEMPPPKEYFDRLMILQAAPLVYLSQKNNNNTRIPFPLHDFDYETSMIRTAVEGATRLEASIDVEVEAASVDNFVSFMRSGGSSRVLHFTGFGHPHHVLAFEDSGLNCDGYLDDTFTVERLQSLVQEAKPPLQLVVVNSFHSGRIGKAFVDAGVPHVVCCHHPEIFRDKAAYSFLKNFYRALATNKSLKQAFYHAQETVRVEEISKHVERYVLLPRDKSVDDTYHDVPIFYTHPATENDVDKDATILLHNDARKTLPTLPRHFIGRELEMIKVLEALRRRRGEDDTTNNVVVRIGGVRGVGKKSLSIAVCRYIQQRQKSFEFDDVFWLPVARGVIPEEDTLFADLVEYTKLILKADHDNISEDEEALECRERIDIEFEGRRSLLAVDSRQFRSETAIANLETFLGELIDNPDLDIQILLINNHDEEGKEVEATIRLGPLDFKSTALLFGTISRFITANGCPAAQSPDEYASLMVPPSIANHAPQEQQQQNKATSTSISLRRSRLMSVMGDGIPSEVIRVGKSMGASVFIRLIGMANVPEVKVDSIEGLEDAITKWTARLELAVRNMNYFRAMDLEHVLKELKGQRAKFPSIDDLIAQEKDLHRKHTLCFKTRKYEEGNRIKREILALKKQIMRAKRMAASSRLQTTKGPNDLTQSQTDKIANIQAQMDSIMKLANSSFSSLTDGNILPEKLTEATFRLGSGYHHCDVCIYPGNVEQFDPGDDLGASVCWTNESCNLTLDPMGTSLSEFGGSNLDKDIKSLPGIADTPWGIVKCGTGNAVIVGPGNYDDLHSHCVILAVGPVSPTREEVFEENDEDSLHYLTVMMRSCIRSSFILAKHSQVQSIAFPTLTTKMGTPTYESTLLTNLKLLVDEAKFSDLNTLHIVTSSEEEASTLIEMALTMGLTMSK